LYPTDVGWYSPIYDGGDLDRINLDALGRDDKAKVSSASYTKFAFAKVGLQTGISETLEDLLDVDLVLCYVLRIDENIVKVSSAEIVQIFE